MLLVATALGVLGAVLGGGAVLAAGAWVTRCSGSECDQAYGHVATFMSLGFAGLGAVIGGLAGVTYGAWRAWDRWQTMKRTLVRGDDGH